MLDLLEKTVSLSMGSVFSKASCGGKMEGEKGKTARTHTYTHAHTHTSMILPLPSPPIMTIVGDGRGREETDD